MNPEVFLDEQYVIPLTKTLISVLMKISNAGDRQSVLEAAGMKPALMGNLRLDSQANIFAQALIAEFKRYRIDSRRLDYHPMVSLLDYFCKLADIYSLSDQDFAMLRQLVDRGEENFKALKVRSGVGRIESPKGTGIGTGVLVGKNLLLTCYHVFSKTGVQQAWVRFGYKTGSYGLEDVFELDLSCVSHHNRPDYALVRIQGEPQEPIVPPINAILAEAQEIRVIHHPLGQPVMISIGKIMQVGEDYIDHNISTDEGSSGAPIFNLQWELVGIHQGRNMDRNGKLGGIPIHGTVWNQIEHHLSEDQQGAS